MNILLCVDVQREFAKDLHGKRLYQKLLTFISEAHTIYDKVIALVYENKDNLNMRRMVCWDEMEVPENLEIRADDYYFHSGYCPLELPKFTITDTVDVIGYDTDACVLATCFRLFDANVSFQILVNGIWSSGGKKAHQVGLVVMNRQFKKAVNTTHKI